MRTVERVRIVSDISPALSASPANVTVTTTLTWATVTETRANVTARGTRAVLTVSTAGTVTMVARSTVESVIWWHGHVSR